MRQKPRRTPQPTCSAADIEVMKNKGIKALLLGIAESILFISAFIYFSPSSLHKLAGNVANDSSLYKYSMTRIIQIYEKDPDLVSSVVLKDYDKNNRYFYVNTVLLSIFADEKSLIKIDKEISKN